MTEKTPYCFQCGSILIYVSEVSEKLPGSFSTQTTTTYRCSNTVCQAQIDSETAKRLKFLEDKAQANIKREEEKLQRKNKTLE